MRLVYLYGPPGVGKLTVARELVALTGFKLFHNHLTVDLVRSVFPLGSERIDTTHLLPSQAAARIAGHYGLPMSEAKGPGTDARSG